MIASTDAVDMNALVHSKVSITKMFHANVHLCLMQMHDLFSPGRQNSFKILL